MTIRRPMFNDKELTRSQSESFVDVPSTWFGDTVECYITFISEDVKEVYNSKYMGNIEITNESAHFVLIR